MGTDNDKIHVCVRLKKDEEDYLCGIASVRISDGITICGIRIYYCRGRLSVVYPCLVKENKRLPVPVSYTHLRPALWTGRRIHS